MLPDARELRQTLGRFATGVTIVSTEHEDELHAMTANSFTSVSLDPPLVGFCIATTSTSWPRIRRAERICINVLSATQEDICKQLATRGGKKFEGVEWSPSPGERRPSTAPSHGWTCRSRTSTRPVIT